jgi:hypothetical protein
MSNNLTEEEHKLMSERLAIVREQIRATGATVLSPTPAWTELHKELRVLARKLK